MYTSASQGTVGEVADSRARGLLTVLELTGVNILKCYSVSPNYMCKPTRVHAHTHTQPTRVYVHQNVVKNYVCTYVCVHAHTN